MAHDEFLRVTLTNLPLKERTSVFGSELLTRALLTGIPNSHSAFSATRRESEGDIAKIDLPLALQ